MRTPKHTRVIVRPWAKAELYWKQVGARVLSVESIGAA